MVVNGVYFEMGREWLNRELKTVIQRPSATPPLSSNGNVEMPHPRHLILRVQAGFPCGRLAANLFERARSLSALVWAHELDKEAFRSRRSWESLGKVVVVVRELSELSYTAQLRILEGSVYGNEDTPFTVIFTQSNPLSLVRTGQSPTGLFAYGPFADLTEFDFVSGDWNRLVREMYAASSGAISSPRLRVLN